MQDTGAESKTFREGRNFDNSRDRNSDRSDPEAEILFQSLAQVREDLCSSLAELNHLRLTAGPTVAGSHGVILRGGVPKPMLEESGSQLAYLENHLLGDGGAVEEDKTVVQGLVALGDELGRLRRELQDAQAELQSARDSDLRINELERSLSLSRQECETLRAELRERVQAQEERSRRSANLVQERADDDDSEAVMKQIDHLSPDQRQATGALPAETDRRLEALALQLHDCQSANHQLRSLLKVFGMVRNLDRANG